MSKDDIETAAVVGVVLTLLTIAVYLIAGLPAELFGVSI